MPQTDTWRALFHGPSAPRPGMALRSAEALLELRRALDLGSRPRSSLLGAYVRCVLSAEELERFGTDGYLVVRGIAPERTLIELDAEVDTLIAGTPPPPDKVGFHHYFEDPARLPAALAPNADHTIPTPTSGASNPRSPVASASPSSCRPHAVEVSS